MSDDRPPETQLAAAARNERRYVVEVRPGMREGQYLGIAVSFWGRGTDWSTANGISHFLTKRADAIAAGERWLDEGRT
jgi:cell wall assembly regulator SMI1